MPKVSMDLTEARGHLPMKAAQLLEQEILHRQHLERLSKRGGEQQLQALQNLLHEELARVALQRQGRTALHRMGSKSQQ
eukprot:11633385-Karenia_brevis.AAC.1